MIVIDTTNLYSLDNNTYIYSQNGEDGNELTYVTKDKKGYQIHTISYKDTYIKEDGNTTPKMEEYKADPGFLKFFTFRDFLKWEYVMHVPKGSVKYEIDINRKD
jgi:hypothetical protein